jgi:hypothetical protein
MTKREVTERDFRMPEFAHAKLEDYEFRDDGKVVRKDRWEQGVRKIHFALIEDGRVDFEIDEVVEAVRALVVERDRLQAAAVAHLFPPGTKVQLIALDEDDECPIVVGDKGEVYADPDTLNGLGIAVRWVTTRDKNPTWTVPAAWLMKID